jgi:serine/threonine protein kinase
MLRARLMTSCLVGLNPHVVRVYCGKDGMNTRDAVDLTDGSVQHPVFLLRDAFVESMELLDGPTVSLHSTRYRVVRPSSRSQFLEVLQRAAGNVGALAEDLIRMLLESVGELHHLNYIHRYTLYPFYTALITSMCRDIKLDNVILSSQGGPSGVAKLIDLAFAKYTRLTGCPRRLFSMRPKTTSAELYVSLPFILLGNQSPMSWYHRRSATHRSFLWQTTAILTTALATVYGALSVLVCFSYRSL